MRLRFSSINDVYLLTALSICRFLLVSLNIEAILGEVTIRQRRKKLQEMVRGNGLSDAYMATLTRLKAQKGNRAGLGLKVLMWVLYSERPLKTQELCHALGAEIGSANLDLENVPALRTLLASCLGLVIVEASSSTVRLVHFTLQEYLLGDPTLFPNPHSTIAEVCLTYLNSGYIRYLSPTIHSAPETTPFLEYASVYWGRHIRRRMTENSKILALRLLDRFDEHISTQLLLLHSNRVRGGGRYFRGVGGPTGFTGLHGAAFLGIAEIVSTVLNMKEWDVNAYDCMGMTALTWATRRGHEEVVKILLERKDVNPNQPDTRDGRTPLMLAAEEGNEGVVKILLEREDVNPNQADTKVGRIPLSWAAKNGHEGVVKVLLQREDVDPNQADTEYGQTPLSWAAEKGYEGVVKMLLQRKDVNPNQVDTYCGQTPLTWAAGKGHEGVVKILLEQEDVNPNLPDTHFDKTPLSWAAEYGCVGVVKLLLQRKDVCTVTLDKEHQTPLSLALSRGHADVVRVLERHDANSHAVDCSGQTSLPP